MSCPNKWKEVPCPPSPFYLSSFACTPPPWSSSCLEYARDREGLSINCSVLRKRGDGQPAWRLMCTLELDPRLVDRCHLQTLSSDKAISRITSEGGGGGKTKALSNLKTTVGACRNCSRALGTASGAAGTGVSWYFPSVCIHVSPVARPGSHRRGACCCAGGVVQGLLPFPGQTPLGSGERRSQAVCVTGSWGALWGLSLGKQSVGSITPRLHSRKLGFVSGHREDCLDNRKFFKKPSYFSLEPGQRPAEG